MIALALPVTLLFASASHAPAQTKAVISRPPQAATAFHSDLLDLGLTYPASLVAEKLPTVAEQHAETARTQPADEKAEYQRADQCTDVILEATRHDNPAQSSGDIAVYGDGRKPIVTLHPAVQGSLTIARVGLECMPAEYTRKMDETVAAAAVAGIKEPGFTQIDQPLWYEVGGTRIHLAAAENRNVEAKTHWFVSIALLSNRSLVLIFMESSDLDFLNEMLHSPIALGKQSPQSLFPASVGQGKPLTLKP